MPSGGPRKLRAMDTRVPMVGELPPEAESDVDNFESSAEEETGGKDKVQNTNNNIGVEEDDALVMDRSRTWQDERPQKPNIEDTKVDENVAPP